MNLDQQALFNISHGVYIIGVRDPQERLCGCVVDAIMQTSTGPLGIALCTNKNSYTNACIDQARTFSVSILANNADPKLIAKFGYNTSKDILKWADVKYDTLAGGVPALQDCISYFLVDVKQKIELSTHNMWLGEVTSTKIINQDTPMTYGFYRKHIATLCNRAQKGEDVQPYQEKKPAVCEQQAPKPQYVCGVCGYSYDGDVPFEDLPDDWVCPCCGMKKEVFSKVE